MIRSPCLVISSDVIAPRIRSDPRWSYRSRVNQRPLVLFGVLALAAVTCLSTARQAVAVSPDQSTNFKGDGSYVGVSSSQSIAQVFTPGQSGSLTMVGLGISKSGSVTNLTIALNAASGGVPTGSALASQTLTGTDLSVITTGQTIFDVTFTSPASVTAGSTYALVATTTDNRTFFPVFGGGDFRWYYSNAYANGNSASKTGGSWTFMGGDLTFVTYVVESSSGNTVSNSALDASSPAVVLQQYGKPTSGTCHSGDPEYLNWGGVPSGGWGESWAQWVSGGNGGAVCTRTLVYSTSQSRWTVG